METWDAIRARRNVRSYSEEAIAPQDLDRSGAARRTPRPATQAGLRSSAPTPSSWPAGQVRRSAGSRRVGGDDRAHRPVPVDSRSRDLIQYTWASAMSIMLAAADLGIGSAHSAVSDQEWRGGCWASPRNRFCAWLISLGVPAGRRSPDPAAQRRRSTRSAPRALVATAPGQGVPTGTVDELAWHNSYSHG